MTISFSPIEESIRIKGSLMKVSSIVYEGKEGEHFIIIAPSLNVSGYGYTLQEANESFIFNMNLFCDTMLSASKEDLESELKKMGFAKKKYQSKNFSKSYVDQEGILQGFEPDTIKQSRLEFTV
jgi:hypothetical protein